MKILHYKKLLGLFLILSVSTLAQAERHICPSIQSIRDAVQDKNALKYERNSLFDLKQFGSFDTTDTWSLYFLAILDKNINEAWDGFQGYLDKTPNTPRYAKESVYSWDCEYPDLNVGGAYFSLSARLKSPPGIHTCPSIQSIRERVVDKDIVQIAVRRNGELSPGTHKVGYLRYFDQYDTNETWILYFEAPWRSTENGTWEEFQGYLDSLPETNRVAEDFSGVDMWGCKYPRSGQDHGYAFATAVLKKP